jgi:hypothetical protein
LSRTTTGRVAELLAEAKLLSLGHRVARESVDEDGVDLLVDRRVTVQVRSSLLQTVATSASGAHRFYVFKSGRGWRADFFVFYGYDEDILDGVWWVVPRSELHDIGGALSILPHGTARKSLRFAAYLDAWDLLR